MLQKSSFNMQKEKIYYLLCLMENNFNSYLKITFVISLDDLPSTPCFVRYV